MVDIKTKMMYKCASCDEYYEYEYDAKSCCIDEKIECEEKIDCYICNICDDEFEIKDDAIKCEEKHKENNDVKYMMYIDRLNREKLQAIGNHPAQSKLKNFL